MAERHRKVRLHSDLHGWAVSCRVSRNLGGGQHGTHLMLTGTHICAVMSRMLCPAEELRPQPCKVANKPTPNFQGHREVAGYLLFHEH